MLVNPNSGNQLLWARFLATNHAQQAFNLVSRGENRAACRYTTVALSQTCPHKLLTWSVVVKTARLVVKEGRTKYHLLHHSSHCRRALQACSTGQAGSTVKHDGEGTRDAVEAWDDGAAAFSDEESPYCLAYRLCRASFAGFDSGRALLAGGVTGVGGGSGEGARRPGGDTW